MAARRKGQGQLDNARRLTPYPEVRLGQGHRAAAGKSKGDDGRGNEIHGRGLRVRMSRVAGTSRKVLQTPFFFQVPPLENFSTQHGYNFSDYETISEGQFSRGMSRQLKTVEFQTMFVDQDWSWTLLHNDKAGLNPQRLSSQVVHILNSGTPFLLLIGQPQLWGEGNYDVKMKATLRSATVEERAGEVDARYINVTFTEWRDLEVQKDAKGNKGDRLPLQIKPGPNDTLRSLAKEYYGSTREWRLIALANGLTNFLPDQKLANPAALQPFITSLEIPAPPAVDKAKSFGKKG